MITRTLTALLLTVFASSAQAAPTASGIGLDIAAVVGEDVISTYDVNSRIKFIIATTNLSNRPEVVEGIRPQVVRTLIDEKLQMKDAAKNEITISDEDVMQAVAGIEKQRGMPAGAIAKILDQNNVPHDTFTSQIRAQLAWSKLVVRKIRPQVKISDEEVRMAHIAVPAPAVKQELQIAVLVLPVDKPSRDGEVKKLGERLSGEIRGGASFEEVYRQFSGLASGGKPDTFWVKPEQLDPALARVLGGAQPGMVTSPIRTNDSYTIVKVYDTRALEAAPPKDVEVLLKEILLKLKEDADPKEADVLLHIGEEVAKNPGTCEEKGVASIKDLADFDIEVNLNRTRLAALPPAVKIIAENLKVGDISTPFATSEGIRLFMLCDRRQASAEAMDKERLSNLLFQKKMELEVQKYMRNLRREAFVEIRA